MATPSTQSAGRAERILKAALRVIGTMALFALVFVAVPYSWMNAIHAWAGLGENMPDEPVVGYLARSLSALYALFAGLLWVISFDLRRHHQVLTYLAFGVILFSAALFGIDYFEGMPASWTYSEGPPGIVFGIAMLYLIRKAKLSEPAA